MKITRLAQATDMNKAELNGTMLTVYHRTKSKDVAGNICNVGFYAGGGAMYGRGIYTTYWYSSSMKDYNLGYGSYVIKGAADISGFIICDYEIAKQVYGRNYSLVDQVKNVIGPDKVINPSRNQERQWTLLKEYSKILETKKWTSSIALDLKKDFSIDKSGVNGVIYTGQHDGRCCVAYNLPVLSYSGISDYLDPSTSPPIRNP